MTVRVRFPRGTPSPIARAALSCGGSGDGLQAPAFFFPCARTSARLRTCGQPTHPRKAPCFRRFPGFSVFLSSIAARSAGRHAPSVPPVSGLCRRRAWTAGSGSETASAWRRTARFPFCPGTSFRSRGTSIYGVRAPFRASSGDGRGSTDIRKKLARPLPKVEDVFAKRHTDDSFRKFRDRPQGKVAISTCARPRNSTDIAQKFYRVLEPGTLLVILFLNHLDIFFYLVNCK